MSERKIPKNARKRGTMAELLPKQPKEPKEPSKKQKRSRRFCLTSYVDPEKLERFVKRSPWIQHYALCTHTRDVEADGKPKGIHTHVILYTYNAHTSSGVRKNFDTFSAEIYGHEKIENTLCQVCHSVVSQFRYLRHLDDPEKAQYEDFEVHTDNDTYWKDLCRTNGMNDASLNTGLQMFDDICEGVHTREMIVRYGKEYIYHMHAFNECVKQHYNEESKAQMSELSFLEFKQIAGDYLADSPVKSADVNTFLNVLDYLHTQFKLDMNVDIGFANTDKEIYR